MAQRWSINEDIIICKYCLANPWAYSSDVDVEGMVSLLEELVGSTRSMGAVKKRAYDYELLRELYERPNIPAQVIHVHETLVSMKSERYQRVKNYIREFYNSTESTNDVHDDLSVFEGGPSDLTHQKRTIDYKSTFPMVLQKYVDLKGIKKHVEMCKRIGMSADTFSAILRGKYKEVKKENVLRICVGLELHVYEAEELLKSAGFCFADGDMTDVVVKAHLWDGIYSVVAINAELDENHEKMLFKNYVIDYEEYAIDYEE